MCANLFSGARNTKICGFDKHKDCYTKAKKMMSKENQIILNCDLKSIDPESICNCLPPCNEVTYDAEIFLKEYEDEMSWFK